MKILSEKEVMDTIHNFELESLRKMIKLQTIDYSCIHIFNSGQLSLLNGRISLSKKCNAIENECIGTITLINQNQKKIKVTILVENGLLRKLKELGTKVAHFLVFDLLEDESQLFLLDAYPDLHDIYLVSDFNLSTSFEEKLDMIFSYQNESFFDNDLDIGILEDSLELLKGNDFLDVLPKRRKKDGGYVSIADISTDNLIEKIEKEQINLEPAVLPTLQKAIRGYKACKGASESEVKYEEKIRSIIALFQQDTSSFLVKSKFDKECILNGVYKCDRVKETLCKNLSDKEKEFHIALASYDEHLLNTFLNGIATAFNTDLIIVDLNMCNLLMLTGSSTMYLSADESIITSKLVQEEYGRKRDAIVVFKNIEGCADDTERQGSNSLQTQKLAATIASTGIYKDALLDLQVNILRTVVVINEAEIPSYIQKEFDDKSCYFIAEYTTDEMMELLVRDNSRLNLDSDVLRTCCELSLGTYNTAKTNLELILNESVADPKTATELIIQTTSSAERRYYYEHIKNYDDKNKRAVLKLLQRVERENNPSIQSQYKDKFYAQAALLQKDVCWSLKASFNNVFDQDAAKETLRLVAHSLNLGIRTRSTPLFAGKPGLGKTLLASALASSDSTTEFIYLSCADGNDLLSRDEKKPGKLLSKIIEASKNCNDKFILFLDEIDKNLGFYSQDVNAVLLNLCTNYLSDSFLEEPVSFANIFIILACNDIDKLSAPLLSRVQLIPFSEFDRDHKAQAVPHLIAQAENNMGINKVTCSLTNEDVVQAFYDESGYDETEVAGLRELALYIESTIQKALLDFDVLPEEVVLTDKHFKRNHCDKSIQKHRIGF